MRVGHNIVSVLKNHNVWPWLGIILLAHGVYGLTAFPNPDEAYYWLWGQHLEWSYYDHPPFHAWVQGLFSRLGHSLFVLRLPTLVSNGLFFGAYWQITTYLYGERAGSAWVITLACCWSSPLYFLFLTLAWQDHWLVTFALWSAYGVIRFLDGAWVRRGNSLFLYGAAAALGVAGLCKYTAVFVGLAALGVVVGHPQLRHLLWDRRCYVATAIASLFTLPILIWNSQNDWLSFQYYLTRSVDSGGSFPLRPDAVLFFWLTAGLILSPPLVWLLAKSSTLQIPSHSPTYRSMVLGLFLTSTGLLSLVGLFSTALYYWNILAYLLLLPLVPLGLLGSDQQSVQQPVPPSSLPPSLPPNPPMVPVSGLRHQRWFWSLQLLGAVVAWLLVINYCLFPISALFGPAGDPDGRMSFGWSTVATVVRHHATQTEQILTTDYRSASALAYALHPRPHTTPPVLAISERLDQFDVWAQDIPLVGKTVLVLADDWHPFTNDGALRLAPGWQPVATISVERWGVPIKKYYLYTGTVVAAQ